MDPAPNVFTDAFSIERGPIRAEPVARKAGAEQLGGTVYELPPGVEGIPMHLHWGMEEMLVVLAGVPTLRTLDGDRELAAGDVVAFPRGRRGAHALANRSEEPVRYLMLSTKASPEVVEYPELGTVRIATHSPLDPPRPGEDPDDRLNVAFDRSAAKE
jgi:uncharacterized cupin superfamily protein